MKCPMCDGQGKVWSALTQNEVECTVCEGQGVYPPETKAEREYDKYVG
jgi:DnaJ-class molecular chaperone